MAEAYEVTVRFVVRADNDQEAAEAVETAIGNAGGLFDGQGVDFAQVVTSTSRTERQGIRLS